MDIVRAVDPQPVVPVTVHVAEGAGYTFAYVTGGGVCGTGHGCPERIFMGDEKLGEFSACEDLDTHAVAPDGSRFFDCAGHGDAGRLIASFAQ